MMKQIINGRKNIYMQPAALKTPRKTIPNMAGWADKIFQGRTKIFNTIAEKFYPRIKIFGRTIFFLTGNTNGVERVNSLAKSCNRKLSLYGAMQSLCETDKAFALQHITAKDGVKTSY